MGKKGEIDMKKEQRFRRRKLPFCALTFIAGSAVIFTGRVLQQGRTTRLAAGLTYAQSASAPPLLQIPEPDSTQIPGVPEAMKEKQRRDLRKYRFRKMKEHGKELAKLAKSLQEDLDKSNENILSLEIVDKAEKIEKLAKKIQNEARYGT
jgi:hypothetical protein